MEIPRVKLHSDNELLRHIYSGEEIPGKVHLCEWEQCMRGFPSRRLLMNHIGSFHIISQDQAQV